MAREADRDLVEVAPNADPPVCRIMDFGKFLFEREKKEREAKKSQTKIEIKEIRLRPKTNVHHRGFKTQDARKWLQDGMKVRVSIKFRGREITYPELALEDLKEIAEELSDVGIIEQSPLLEGKMMGMTLAPAKFAKKKVEAATTAPVAATPAAAAPAVPAVPVAPPAEKTTAAKPPVEKAAAEKPTAVKTPVAKKAAPVKAAVDASPAETVTKKE
jgi:translation initiation factor IF-3